MRRSSEQEEEGEFALLANERRAVFRARVDPRTSSGPGSPVRLSVDPRRSTSSIRTPDLRSLQSPPGRRRPEVSSRHHGSVDDPFCVPGSGELCSTTFRRSLRVRHRRFESVHAPRLYVASTSTDALECFRPFRSVRAGGTERNPGVVSGSPLSPRCLHLADGSQPRAHPRKPNGRVVCYEGCRPCQAVLARGLTAST